MLFLVVDLIDTTSYSGLVCLLESRTSPDGLSAHPLSTIVTSTVGGQTNARLCSVVGISSSRQNIRELRSGRRGEKYDHVSEHSAS